MTKKRVATRAFVKRLGRKRNDVKNGNMVNLTLGYIYIPETKKLLLNNFNLIML